jgi:hypothetical protein
MGKQSKTVLFAALAGRILAGVFGWMLVFVGSLGVFVSLLVYVGDYPGKSPLLSALSFSVCLLVVAVGIYGNPRFREQIHASLR